MRKPEQKFRIKPLYYNGFANWFRGLLVAAIMACTQLLHAQTSPPNLLIHGDFEMDIDYIAPPMSPSPNLDTIIRFLRNPLVPNDPIIEWSGLDYNNYQDSLFLGYTLHLGHNLPNIFDRRFENNGNAHYYITSDTPSTGLGQRVIAIGQHQSITQQLSWPLKDNGNYTVSGDIYLPTSFLSGLEYVMQVDTEKQYSWNWQSADTLNILLGLERGPDASITKIPIPANVKENNQGGWFHFSVPYPIELDFNAPFILDTTNRHQFSFGLDRFAIPLYAGDFGIIIDNLSLVGDCNAYARYLNDTISTTTTWTATTISNVYTNSNFEAGTVAGSLVINNNSTLTIGSTTGAALTMLMNPDAKIVVKAGSHLIINNVTLRSTTVAPCAGLWQGIVVEAGGRLTMNNAKIYDARIGVDYQGNGTVIDNSNERRLAISGNSLFDRNGISVRISRVSSESNSEAFKITNTTFNHNSNSALPNVNLGTRIGVLLDSALLNVATASYFTGNTFNGGDIQLKLNNAKMQIAGCTLTNASTHAILATTNYPANSYLVTITNNTIKNTNNLSTQIALTGGMAGEISSNKLEGAGQDAILYRGNKFASASASYRLTIYNNTIKDFGKDGIADRAGIFLNDNLSASVLVDRNTITGTVNSYSYTIGLRIDMHYMPSMSGVYSVDTRVGGANSNNTGNKFNGVRMGIGCKNAEYVNLSNNAVSWDLTNANATDRYGIWLEYIKNYILRYNHVSQSQLMSTNAIGMGIFWSTDFQAIINTPFPDSDDLYPIRYNNFTKLNTAVVLGGHNFSARKAGSGNQRIIYNIITDCTEGFRLASTMLFTQTSVANGTSTQTSPNTFTNTPVQWTVFADNPLGTDEGAYDINTKYNPYCKWYPTNWCNRTVQYYNQKQGESPVGIPSSQITAQFLLKPANLACPVNPDTAIQTARVAATDSPAVLDSASRWNQRYFTLAQEDSTAAETTPADRFTRRMLRAEKLLHQGRYAQAQHLLGLMQPSGLVEQTHKKVLMHYLAYSQSGGQLSPPAIEELKLIAAQNPAHAGTGVLLANGLLTSGGYPALWHYDYQPLPVAASEPVANRMATQVSLYPNPAHHTLHIRGAEGRLQLSLMYALTGQKVLEQSLAADAPLNISDLRKGLYYYLIQAADGSRHTGMLSIE